MNNPNIPSEILARYRIGGGDARRRCLAFGSGCFWDGTVAEFMATGPGSVPGSIVLTSYEHGDGSSIYVPAHSKMANQPGCQGDGTGGEGDFTYGIPDAIWGCCRVEVETNARGRYSLLRWYQVT